LFDEVVLARKAAMDMSHTSAPLNSKWMTIFKSTRLATSNLHRLVSFVLSVPVSNAFCERVFSDMKDAWSDDRSKLTVESVEAELMIRKNFENVSCAAYYQSVKEDEIFLKKISSQEKYDHKKNLV
jgi:hypothetical protein